MSPSKKENMIEIDEIWLENKIRKAVSDEKHLSYSKLYGLELHTFTPEEWEKIGPFWTTLTPEQAKELWKEIKNMEKPKWIKCIDRMPEKDIIVAYVFEKNGRAELCLGKLKTCQTASCSNPSQPNHEEERWWNINTRDYDHCNEVVKWYPIPTLLED